MFLLYNTSAIFRFLVYFAVLFFSLFLWKSEKNQSISWTYPYFSGAANNSNFFEWKISKYDWVNVKSLEYGELSKYKFQNTPSKIEYNYNDYGYVWFVKIAKIIFPFVGDYTSVIILQIIIHSGISFFVMRGLCCSITEEWIFFLFYVINPVILKFVTMPFYYYISSLSTFFLIIFILKKKSIATVGIFGLILSILFLFRSLNFIILSFFIFIVLRQFKKSTASLLALTILSLALMSVIIAPKSRTIWHSMYIGMYAYDTVNTVDDDFGYDAYYKNTGLNIDTDPVQGNFYNNKGYVNFVRNEVIAIIRFSKCKVMLNAFKNVVTSFSIIGYIPGNGALNKISFVFGAFSLFLLIYNKLYLILFTILTYNLGFILYFPPISAYNLGVLFPLAFGLIMLKRKLNLSKYNIKSFL